MQVKLSQVRPNPFRDSSSYPINKEKVEALKSSMELTGFWENLIGRMANGHPEIAYGHHRLIALEEKYGDDYEFDLRIRKLTDAQMIQIMAQENMEDWALNPVVTMETVKVAKRFLEKNADIARTHFEMCTPKSKLKEILTKFEKYGAGAEIIYKFLSWPEQKVTDALSCLRATGEIPERGEKQVKEEQKILDKKDITKMPTQKHAVELVKAAKSVKPSEKVKEKIIKQVKSNKIGARKIKGAMTRLQEKETPKEPKSKKEQKQIDFEDFINECRKDVNRLRKKIKFLMAHKTSFDSDYGSKISGHPLVPVFSSARNNFRYCAKSLMKKIGSLLGEKGYEEKKQVMGYYTLEPEDKEPTTEDKEPITTAHPGKKLLTAPKQLKSFDNWSSDDRIAFQRQLGRTMKNFDTLLADLVHERTFLGCTGIDNFNFSIGFPSIHQHLETLLKRWHW